MLKTSEIKAIFDPEYLSTVQAGIMDVIADLEALVQPRSTRISPKTPENLPK